MRPIENDGAPGGIEARYVHGDYLHNNPQWHSEHAPWKAALVARLLSKNGIQPAEICEIGCGSGAVLLSLRKHLPKTRLVGFDISPQVSQFWEQHAASGANIEFQRGSFDEIGERRFDVLLMLDVFEHVRDPFTFLEQARRCAAHFVFLIPLDLSASAVARGRPLLDARRIVGHLHYYTKDLALAVLADGGYEIVHWRYTGASLHMPSRSLKTQLASLPRRILYALNRDLAVRLVGGDSLLVLARPAV